MKPYVKPDLFYENFELNQTIAACRWDMNNTDTANCTAEYDPNMNNQHTSGLVLFNDNPCTVTEKDNSLDYCYTTGTSAEQRLFNS